MNRNRRRFLPDVDGLPPRLAPVSLAAVPIPYGPISYWSMPNDDPGLDTDTDPAEADPTPVTGTLSAVPSSVSYS